MLTIKALKFFILLKLTAMPYDPLQRILSEPKSVSKKINRFLHFKYQNNTEILTTRLELNNLEKSEKISTYPLVSYIYPVILPFIQ